MIGRPSSAPVRSKDEGEKPFWISFADLMTAMMVLFLVVLVSSLVSLTKRINEAEAKEKNRTKEISTMCKNLKNDIEIVNPKVKVDCKENRINFGDVGQFEKYKYVLNDDKALMDVAPLILRAANSTEGKKWMRQVVIEGFASRTGTYLFNLNLSLQRSQWVMCRLLSNASESSLTPQQKKDIRRLFLTGGVSFSNAKEDDAASQRVEMRLNFYGLNDGNQRELDQSIADNIENGVCSLKP